MAEQAESEWINGRLVRLGTEICMHGVGLTPGLWCGACLEDKSPVMGPADGIIDDVILEYRQEMLDAMNRYHGCDRHGGNPCRADVYRVDRVILPVVRKMLEDVWEDGQKP